MKYFISTINFSPLMREKISDVIPEMIDKGIKNIEISSLHPYEENLNFKKYSANILFHNFAPPIKENLLINLCSPKNAEKVKRFIKDRILLTKQLGQKYYSFHAGFRLDYLRALHYYEDRLTYSEAMMKFSDAMTEIVEFAEKQKLHIGIENHCSIKENKDNLMLYDLVDWDSFFRGMKSSSYLHLHLDIGHLKISSNEHKFDAKTFLETVGYKVMAVHVHDNTGYKVDCHAPFGEDFWFDEDHWRLLNNLEYVILETKTFGDMGRIYKMIEILEERI